MNFLLIQIILTTALLLFVVYVFRIRTLLTDRIIYIILVAAGVLVVIHPEISNWIANSLGVGRGADLIFYIFIIFSLFHHVNKTSQLKKMEHQLTDIVRKMAIDEGMVNMRSQKDTHKIER